MTNDHPGKCACCHQIVPAQGGYLIRQTGRLTLYAEGHGPYAKPIELHPTQQQCSDQATRHPPTNERRHRPPNPEKLGEKMV